MNTKITMENIIAAQTIYDRAASLTENYQKTIAPLCLSNKEYVNRLASFVISIALRQKYLAYRELKRLYCEQVTSKILSIVK